MLARMQRKGNPLTLLVGMQTGAATLENSMEVPQKVKNRGTWVAQSVEWPTLGFGSRGDLRVVRSSPVWGSVLSGESA